MNCSKFVIVSVLLSLLVFVPATHSQDIEPYARGIYLSFFDSDGNGSVDSYRINGDYRIALARDEKETDLKVPFYASPVFGSEKAEGKIKYFNASLLTALTLRRTVPIAWKFSASEELEKFFVSVDDDLASMKNDQVWLLMDEDVPVLRSDLSGEMHHFDGKLKASPQLEQDICFVRKIDKDRGKKLKSANVTMSFVFQTPLPEFKLVDSKQYGADAKFRYKVEYLDKDKKAHFVKHLEVGKARRGIRSFKHKWKVEWCENKLAPMAKYQVTRQVWSKTTGAWIDDHGGDMAGGWTELKLPLGKSLEFPSPSQ